MIFSIYSTRVQSAQKAKERIDASYILTRNNKNFDGSTVLAITPTDFLKN